MRPGMFVTTTFHGRKKQSFASLPATAILHLQDKDWVYIPAGDKTLRRIEVKSGDMLPGNMQVILSGVSVGQDVVSNALEFQNTVQQ
jgi:cobalt-zinc-cadmium efflux system membrane fusion protein